MELAVFLLWLAGFVAAVREGARPGHFTFCALLLVILAAVATVRSHEVALFTTFASLAAILVLGARFAHERVRSEFRAEDVYAFCFMLGMAFMSWLLLAYVTFTGQVPVNA